MNQRETIALLEALRYFKKKKTSAYLAFESNSMYLISIVTYRNLARREEELPIKVSQSEVAHF